VPNYYRGAWRELPRTAGRSSQLFNTGTAAWLYRCLIEGLFGLKGEGEALCVRPQLPSHWRQATVQRRFRGAVFEVRMQRDAGCVAQQVSVDGQVLDVARIEGIESGRRYRVEVMLPEG
jgi:cellobionic acid phosphorylase